MNTVHHQFSLLSFVSIGLLLFLLACQPKTLPPAPAPTLLSVPADYEEQIRNWQQKRQENQLKPDGWYSLTGLWWLKEGPNTFGGSSDQDITFPGNFPDHLGTYTPDGDKVNVQVADIAGLSSSDESSYDMSYGVYRWSIIERGGRFGVRLKDLSRTASIRVAPLEFFPIDPGYRVLATFTPLVDSSLVMDNRQNMPFPVDLVGTVDFILKGQSCQLPALAAGPDDLFLIISDETTGGETYGGGRYIYCPAADENGQTIIDFNKAFTPPCAITDFATCLLPGPEHRLPLAVRAGEKAP